MTNAMRICVHVCWILYALLFGVPAQAQEGERQKVERAVKAVFDKPAGSLQVAPIVVAGDYAVAGWTQGSRGGRAVLSRYKSEWAITVCGGDGLRDAESLAQTGIPKQYAIELARNLAAEESRQSPETRRKFSSFDGIVKMSRDAAVAAPAKHAASH